MLRYGIKVDGKWVTIGRGFNSDVQYAYLYSNERLAKLKVEYFLRNPQWYKTVEIVTFRVYENESAEADRD